MPAFAGQFQVGSRTYWVDGKPYQMDAAPFTEKGRTYVPLRYLALALGVAEKDIQWNAKSGTATLKLGDTTVRLTAGKKTIYVNGQPRQMDVAPVVRNGRTYLPARWVAEAFGYQASWDASSQKVVLAYAGTATSATEPKPAEGGPEIEWSKIWTKYEPSDSRIWWTTYFNFKNTGSSGNVRLTAELGKEYGGPSLFGAVGGYEEVTHYVESNKTYTLIAKGYIDHYNPLLRDYGVYCVLTVSSPESEESKKVRISLPSRHDHVYLLSVGVDSGEINPPW